MSAPIKCPKCGAHHPAGVKVCDCGDDLSVMVTNPPAAPASRTGGVAGEPDPDRPSPIQLPMDVGTPLRHRQAVLARPTSHGSAWPFTIIATVIHTVLVFVLFLSLILWVPRFDKIFKDFNMALPSSTRWVMAISRWLSEGWYILIFPAVVLVNLLIVYRLRVSPGSRRLGLHWLWFYAVIFLVLLAGGTVLLAIHLPRQKLLEGLSK